MRNFILRSVLPTLVTAALFVTAMFAIILPTMERAVMDQKREMIRELTNSAWNILAWFDARARAGELTQEQARHQALEEIKTLHYGRDMKSYFWVNDFHPRMIIHPYRPDLNGKDLTDFTDPSGVKLFVEAVRVVKTAGSGYISYMWQWMDDPARIVPKISYVKGYEPWGWIIGTGVYIDDVRFEMSSLEDRLTLAAVTITLAMTLLVSYLLWGAYRAEILKGLALNSLKSSEERYRLLVESAGEYIILALGGQGLFANASMLNLLGCTAEEMSAMTVADVLEPCEEERQTGIPFHQRFLRGEKIPRSYEAQLRCRDGTLKRVMVSLSSIAGTGENAGDRKGFLIVASEMTPRQERVLHQDRLLQDLQRSLLYMHGTVGDLPLAAAPVIAASSTVRDAAALMCGSGEPPVPGKNGPLGVPVGIVVEEKGMLLPQMVIGHAAAGTLDTPLADIALPPARTIPGSTLLFDAWISLEKNGFAPLLVQDSADVQGRTGETPSAGQGSRRPVGQKILCIGDFSAIASYAPTNILREIQDAGNPSDMASAARRVPELAGILMRNGVKSSHVTSLVSDVSDTAVTRAVEMAKARLGPPPTDFCFLVMGSEGRREQTLCTDQDNALIFADPREGGQSDPQVAAWFESLGKIVCDALESCGYEKCRGGIMASNPRWCQSLSSWKSDFRKWISTSEAEDLLQAKIFFDFRSVAGNSALAAELEETLESSLSVNPAFFPLMARNVLLQEPPLGLFGNFVVKDTGAGESGIDAKNAMSIIVDFARIYALRHGIRARGTLDRLGALRDKGVLTQQSHNEIVQAHGFLMKLRIENQLSAMAEAREPDNMIRPYSMTTQDQRALKETFALLKHFQVRLSYDFTGMMAT